MNDGVGQWLVKPIDSNVVECEFALRDRFGHPMTGF